MNSKWSINYKFESTEKINKIKPQKTDKYFFIDNKSTYTNVMKQ